MRPSNLLAWFLRFSFLLTLLAASASAQITLNTTNAALRAKAQPDECFIGLGQNIPFTKPPCFLGKPKVNQGYIWGATSAGNGDLWFGTVANPQCITEAGLFPTDSLIPYQTDSWVCEFGKSAYVPIGLLPAPLGDFRPPRVYVYNEATHALVDKTPTAPVGPTNPLGLDPIVYATRGFRGAVLIGNTVIMAGPSLLGGLNLLFYDRNTQAYLGSGTIPVFDNIRQLIVVNNQLYVPVGTNLQGGNVLRLTLSIKPAPCASNCVSFTSEVVGNFDGIGAFIALHNGRFFVTTWPTGVPGVVSGLFMSPPIGNGLTAANANQWTKVWDASQYEPDAAVAAGYAGGAVESFDGFLYWGTMHVPWFSTAIFLGVNGSPTTDLGWTNAIVNTFRTATIFRGQNFDTAPNIQLLYGLPVLPKFTPVSSGGAAPDGTWTLVDNNMPAGTKNPLYGPPGFGNAYNNYTWRMAVWDNRLWVGSMDWSYPAEQGTEFIFKQAGQTVPVEIGSFFAFQNFGADLYFFQSSASSAVLEDDKGLGNFTSYGVRAMVPEANSFFLGMANPSNLLTGAIGPKGGWELLELTKKPGKAPLNLMTGFSCKPPAIAGPGTVLCTVTLAQPSTGTALTVGLFPVLFAANVTAPSSVVVPVGSSSVQFNVQVSEARTAATLYLIAGANGATLVAPVAIQPGVPKLAGVFSAVGKLASGVSYVDVKLTNTGTGMANSVSFTQLLPRTLGGTGTITLATGGPGLSPALPIKLGPLAPGGTTTLRITLNVPSTVTRFSLTESGGVLSLGGTNYKFSLGQSIIP